MPVGLFPSTSGPPIFLRKKSSTSECPWEKNCTGHEMQSKVENRLVSLGEQIKKLRKKDIVFGRGRRWQVHPGNERMRAMVDSCKEHYHSLNSDRKHLLTEQIYATLIEGGARFVKKVAHQHGNYWIQVERQASLRKITNCLRYRKVGEICGRRGKQSCFENGTCPASAYCTIQGISSGGHFDSRSNVTQCAPIVAMRPQEIGGPLLHDYRPVESSGLANVGKPVESSGLANVGKPHK